MFKITVASVCIGFLSFMASPIVAQNEDQDALFIKKIHDFTLTQSRCHGDLKTLCKDIGNRLSGTENYNKAADFTKDILAQYCDTTYLQECEVSLWDRGAQEECVIMQNGMSRSIPILALGHSIGTGPQGVMGDIIEVQSLDEVRQLGRAGIAGKIVFYNRPMDPTQVATFRAYGGAVDQRVYGATTAAEFGALASITRSMSIEVDTFPHTGTLSYREDFPKVPGLCISTAEAEALSQMVKQGRVQAKIVNHSREIGMVPSYTVVGEIKGSEFPDEIILVGGHLDSWDVGEGAHDDGTGVVQSMEVLHTLKSIGYQPKRTLRCVLFANEESGLAGGREYARVSNEKGEYHLAALESDSGGFSPNGFKMEGHEEVFSSFYQKVSQWAPLFEAYGLLFNNGGSGADISPLKSQKGLLIGLSPDSQRYFDLHHTHNDVFENVHPRELKLGAAAMTSLIYLIDKYGLQ